MYTLENDTVTQSSREEQLEALDRVIEELYTNADHRDPDWIAETVEA
jgi:hypothetical protein